jgi:hypothetical protein
MRHNSLRSWGSRVRAAAGAPYFDRFRSLFDCQGLPESANDCGESCPNNCPDDPLPTWRERLVCHLIATGLCGLMGLCFWVGGHGYWSTLFTLEQSILFYAIVPNLAALPCFDKYLRLPGGKWK